jgi:putative ABC transport system permease protein
MGWLDVNHVVPGSVQLQALLALGFMLVCVINTVALLLVKFLRRGGELSVRRAMGASRRSVFAQLLIEASNPVPMLDDPAQVDAYRQFLLDYSAQQKELGRYERPASEARLYGLMPWLHHEGLVPNDVMLQTWLALGFLFVCLVNIVALLLAKFLRKGGEISVRRALGARRSDVFRQLGVESALIGVAGGVLGIALAELGLWAVRLRPNDYAHLARMNGAMLLATVVLAIVVSLLAGWLPAWRACRIAPALQLKTL